MIKKILFFCTLIFLCYCTPQQRLNKLLKKHPELVKRLDTTIIDTFITRSFYYDTTLKANFFRDTIVINKNNIQTKVFYNYKTDSLFINNYVAPDTLIKNITVPAKTVEIKNKFDGIKYIFYLAIVFLLLLGIIKATNSK